jgi:hypothetical protein
MLIAGQHARIDVLGVFADGFEYSSILPLRALEELAEGTATRLDSQFPSPEGVPAPCNYSVATATGLENWGIDLDCRPTAVEDGHALIAQFVPNDSSQSVQISEQGLDYHNAVLLFLDDDSPCYVRIFAPTASDRLSLAKLVAPLLSERTAPMRTIYRRRK